MKVKINTSVVDGRLKSNRKTLANAIKEFNGMNITITIEKKKKPRSVYQNSYYWGVINPLIQACIKDSWGERKTKDEVHEILKTNCNYVEKVNENTGEIIKISKSTTENSTVEQEEFHEDCRRFAQEWFGIIIPLPNDKMELEFE